MASSTGDCVRVPVYIITKVTTAVETMSFPSMQAAIDYVTEDCIDRIAAHITTVESDDPLAMYRTESGNLAMSAIRRDYDLLKEKVELADAEAATRVIYQAHVNSVWMSPPSSSSSQ
jgi:hypothetical protein